MGLIYLLRERRLNELVPSYVGKKITEGRIGVTGRGGRRPKQLLDEFKGTKGYWKLKEEELDRPLWLTRFGRSNGRALLQATE